MQQLLSWRIYDSLRNCMTMKISTETLIQIKTSHSNLQVNPNALDRGFYSLLQVLVSTEYIKTNNGKTGDIINICET